MLSDGVFDPADYSAETTAEAGFEAWRGEISGWCHRLRATGWVGACREAIEWKQRISKEAVEAGNPQARRPYLITISTTYSQNPTTPNRVAYAAVCISRTTHSIQDLSSCGPEPRPFATDFPEPQIHITHSSHDTNLFLVDHDRFRLFSVCRSVCSRSDLGRFTYRPGSRMRFVDIC